jgi:hypothetical protein
MLGAAGELAAAGSPSTRRRAAVLNGLDTVLTLEQAGRLGDVVVVHLGTNGNIQPDDMTR